MNFNFYLVKSFRILLFPFSLIVWFFISIRNFFYDKGYYRSVSFNLPLICVGNISVGGTGKSPMVELLLRTLSPSFRVATLSRGYKRKTRGYALAGPHTTALDIGDEPMQFHTKFPEVPVAVGEERLEAIPQLLHDKPGTEVIILDDAFQHRKVKAGLNILLTDCNNLYTRDLWLPSGDLRDNIRSARRADIIIVTKCPSSLDTSARTIIIDELRPTPVQYIFFSTISYGTPYHIVTKQIFNLHQQCEVLLVCGIANPRPLKQYLEKKVSSYNEKIFADHHIFTIDDLKDIRERFKTIEGGQNIILTTEKDAVRLLKFEKELLDLPLYVLPIEHEILFDGGEQFRKLVTDFILHFNKASVAQPR